VAVYRKALFRHRNQTRKRTLFTLKPRRDARRGDFQPLNRRKFTLNALNFVLGSNGAENRFKEPIVLLAVNCVYPTTRLTMSIRFGS